MGFFSDIGDAFTDVYHGLTGETASRAAKEAAGTAAGAQMESLEYLKEVNKLPQQYREQALTKMADIYGLGDPGAQEGFFQGLTGSPIYQSIMGGKEAGEEAILRQAGATGGLRSGNVQDALARYSGDLERQALMDALQFETGGLSGLAGLDTGTRDIASTISGIGSTQAAGITGAAQAKQAGMQNLLNTALMGGSLFI